PQVMMDHLEVPDELAGLGIECEQAVRIQIVARPLATILGHGRSTRWHIQNPETLVDRQRRPRGHVAHVCPGPPGVGFVHVELPDQLSSSYIERADVFGSRPGVEAAVPVAFVTSAAIATENDDIADDQWAIEAKISGVIGRMSIQEKAAMVAKT